MRPTYCRRFSLYSGLLLRARFVTASNAGIEKMNPQLSTASDEHWGGKAWVRGYFLVLDKFRDHTVDCKYDVTK